jgi:hypothetical protein
VADDQHVSEVARVGMEAAQLRRSVDALTAAVWAMVEMTVGKRECEQLRSAWLTKS